MPSPKRKGFVRVVRERHDDGFDETRARLFERIVASFVVN